MGLCDKRKLNGPVFYKDDSEAERQLAALQELRKKATGKVANAIEEEIRLVQAGIAGEKQVRFELENSHIPMYVLHDLYLEHEGLTAQIDYLIITRKHQFLIECKNLYGDIEINSCGDFIRTFSYGRRKKKEGLYSPITQNKRHLELIKQIKLDNKNGFIKLIFSERLFLEYHISVVVLANPKTILTAKNAPKDIRDQVIRADQLSEYIRKHELQSKDTPDTDEEMKKRAEFYCSIHKENAVDYTKKFREMLTAIAPEPKGNAPMQNEEKQTIRSAKQMICPKCGAPMVKRKARRGDYIGNVFYGCSRYPQCREIINTR